MDEDQIEIDPLFVGMTRPVLVKGVPMEYFGIIFIIFGVGMIGLTSLMSMAIFFITVCIPLYLLGRLITEREPHWMSIYLTKATKCAPTRNKIFWKSNSFKP